MSIQDQPAPFEFTWVWLNHFLPSIPPPSYFSAPERSIVCILWRRCDARNNSRFDPICCIAENDVDRHPHPHQPHHHYYPVLHHFYIFDRVDGKKFLILFATVQWCSQRSDQYKWASSTDNYYYYWPSFGVLSLFVEDKQLKGMRKGTAPITRRRRRPAWNDLMPPHGAAQDVPMNQILKTQSWGQKRREVDVLRPRRRNRIWFCSSDHRYSAVVGLDGAMQCIFALV